MGASCLEALLEAVVVGSSRKNILCEHPSWSHHSGLLLQDIAPPGLLPPSRVSVDPVPRSSRCSRPMPQIDTATWVALQSRCVG